MMIINQASVDFVCSVGEDIDELIQPYKSPFWYNRHIFTLFLPLIFPTIEYRRELLMSTQDCVASFALDWAFPSTMSYEVPVVILLPGLGGHSRSSYACEIGQMALRKLGAVYVVLNARGSCTPLTSPDAFNKADTNDLAQTVDLVQARYASSPIIIVGCSVGGALVTKYLQKSGADVTAAISICNCFDYKDVLEKLEESLVGSTYSHLFAMYQQTVIKNHKSLFQKVSGFDIDLALRCKTLLELDSVMAVPIFGFASVEAYHESLQLTKGISSIKVPFLNIQPRDDPCFTPGTIDIILERIHINPQIISVIPHQGGHLSFAEFSCSGESYLERITEAFCLKILK